jgi:hypothetical protein
VTDKQLLIRTFNYKDSNVTIEFSIIVNSTVILEEEPLQAVGTLLQDNNATLPNVVSDTFTIMSQPIYKDFIPSSSTQGVIALSLVGAALLFTTIVGILIWMHRNKPGIKGIDPRFSILMILGIGVAQVGITFHFDLPTTESCMTRYALLYVPFGLVYG